VNVKIANAGRLVSVVKGQPNAVLLLGAGASVKSGIPLAGGVVEKAAKWAYCRENGRSPDDPSIARSDWFPWLRGKSWYNANASGADNYHAAVEHLLQPKQDRSDFFLKLITPGVAPSKGYLALVDLMARNIVQTVLTTNFDRALLDAQEVQRRPHFINVIKTPSDYTKFSTSPSYPQLVYLHGSVEHYTDRNLLEEIQHLEDSLVRILIPLLRDHPLIVLGYRGAEPSIMQHLLLDNLDACHSFRHGIYWCAVDGEANDSSLSALTQTLAAAIKTNFQLVAIKGFDEIVANEIAPRMEDVTARPAAPPAVVAAPASQSPDFERLDSIDVDQFEWALMRDRLVNYCTALGIQLPSQLNRPALLNLAEQLNLVALGLDGRPRPTTAGYLLFGRVPQECLPSARIVFQLKGDQEYLRNVLSHERNGDDELGLAARHGFAERTFEGNLWAQLDAALGALAMINRPFRLKGEPSQTVFPYPSLALKEIVVNALVHRDYRHENLIRIEVEPTFVRISNPGGLVYDVTRRLENHSLEVEIKRGRKGIKGYRNPVLADLFYGAGDMDKAGSGLSDVCKLVAANAGDVHFGASSANDFFELTIFARQEAIDTATSTASPLVLTCLLYTSPSPRDLSTSRMPSSA